MKKGFALFSCSLLFTLTTPGCYSEANNPALTFVDGQAQERYGYTEVGDDYTNKDSEILRFVVYVESDYDTDMDEKNDLIHTFVQVPKEVVEKKYKVANIMQATPYATGTFDYEIDKDIDLANPEEKEITEEQLFKRGTYRNRTSEVDILTQAYNTKKEQIVFDLYARNGEVETSGHWNMTAGDYFLIRGFAHIMVSGFGSYDSDGINTVGHKNELKAYEAAIEWLNGERVAFTDRKGSNTIRASFSNGRTAALGASYIGTLAYELACMNIKGLKTAIPTAGIASWYDYIYQYGALVSNYPYYEWLSYYCNTKLLEFDEKYREKYASYHTYLYNKELNDRGNYTSFHSDRDFTKDITPSCPLLIVHGLNDFNVEAKHSIKMYDLFKKAGQTAKLVLHQGSHLGMYSAGDTYYMGSQENTYFNILNKWLSHYLYDVDNKIEAYPDVTYQSNTDGSFQTMNDFTTFKDKVISLDKPSRTSITSKDLDYCFWIFEDDYYDKDDKNTIVYNLGTMTDDTTYSGTFQLDIKLKTEDVNRENLTATAVLLDTYEEEFDAYGCIDFEADTNDLEDIPLHHSEAIEGTFYQATTEKTNTKVISYATWDLHHPGRQELLQVAPHRALSANHPYEYHLDMTPNIYTIKKGHTLKLVLFTFDPGGLSKRGYFYKELEDYLDEGEYLASYSAWSGDDPYSYCLDETFTPKLTLKMK